MIDPYVLAASRTSRLVPAQRVVELGSLAELPIIEFGHSEERFASWLKAQGIEPNIVLRSDDNATVLALVAADVGVAVVPRLTVQRRSDVRLARVKPTLEPRRIGIVWHGDRRQTELAKTFLGLAAAAGRRADGAGRSR